MQRILLSPKDVSSLWMFLTLTLLFFSIEGRSQTQKTSVRTGVTFQWSDTQTDNDDPATIESITVDGLVYSSFAVPSSYEMTRVGNVGDHRNTIIENGNDVNTDSSDPDWNDDALAAFQDKNLNHYFTSNTNGKNICEEFDEIEDTDAQIQSLYYASGIPSNAGGIIAITERNANNCYYISVYGIPAGGGPEGFLGDTFVLPNTHQSGPLFNAPPEGVDYWNSGRVVENNGTIGIALFTLDQLAEVGSTITRIELLASSRDHGDGKVLIMQKYATPRTETQCAEFEYNGTVGGSFNIPPGSTFTLTSAPVPAGQGFVFNPDGSYIYTPDEGFVGDVVFEYEVCLPAPNDSVCDISTVTLTYRKEGCNQCESSNADGPLLRN